MKYLVNCVLLIVVNKPLLSILPGNKSIVESSLVVLQCLVNASDPINIIWFYNNRLVKGSSEELILSNIQRNQSGAYRCNINNSFGSSNSLSMNLVVDCK